MAVGVFRSRSNVLLPSAVLLAGLALSGWLYASLGHDRTTYDDARFERIVNIVESQISGSFKTYEQALWGAAGHLSTSERISPTDWRIYVNRLRLLDLYPGVTATSIVQPVSQGELARFVEAHRNGEWPAFTPHRIPTASPEPTLEHFLTICAEPPAVATVAIGGDLATDPIRGAAAELARDSAAAILTKSVALGDGSGKGMQLFVPVYREGAPLSSGDDRRRALTAWVTIVFKPDTFLRATFGGTRRILRLDVYEGDSIAPADLVFSSVGPTAGPQPAERISRLTLGGRTWTLVWRRLPHFPYLSRTPAVLTAGCTALLSLLLAGLVTTLQAAGRETADRLDLIQSALTLGTWEFDVRCGVVRCSEQLLRLYGVQGSHNNLSLDEWLKYVHPDDRAAMIAESGGRNGEVIDQQYRAVWSDGSMHWLHRKALAMSDNHGQPLLIIGVDFDVSEIKELQNRLAQAQKLESVGQLAAGVAHEINTPIQYIGDNAKFLEDSFRDLITLSQPDRAFGNGSSKEDGVIGVPSDKNQRTAAVLEYLRIEVPKALTQLLEGVDQVARIVRAMKEFSHPGRVEMTAVDINRAIESTILVSKNEWKYVADLTTDLDPNLVPVQCVTGEFNQVVLNLIVNAAHAISDFVKDSGRKGVIHISTRQHDGMVEIRISDTGGGIPPAIQSRVFDPFFTTKPVGKGTGQGLAIAHSVIVQKHKGTLTFESEPGCGTTFLIQLPLSAELEAV